MFTGIIQNIGEIVNFSKGELEISTPLDLSDCKTGSSICCDGVCLTAIDINLKDDNYLFKVNVGEETQLRTNYSNNKIYKSKKINLEKSLKVGDEISGHFVYGHVDTTSKVRSIEKINGSYKISFYVQDQFMKYFSPKGSVSIDGVSLTVNEVFSDTFSVNIIPHTWAYTSFLNFKIGTVVNIEIDILARYLDRLNAKN